MKRDIPSYRRVPVGTVQFASAVMETIPSFHAGMNIIPDAPAYSSHRHDMAMFANFNNKSGALHSITLKASSPLYIRSVGDRYDADDVFITIMIVSVTFRVAGGISFVMQETRKEKPKRYTPGDIESAGGQIRQTTAVDIRTYIRRYMDSTAIEHAKRMVEGAKGTLDKLRTHKELSVMFEGSKLEPYHKLFYLACPYSRMVAPTGAASAVISVAPWLYNDPRQRKAIRANDFKRVISLLTGNVTKPVMRAAIRHSKSVGEHKSVQTVQYYDVSGTSSMAVRPDAEVVYPALYDGEMFRYLIDKQGVPLEKAAEIAGRSSACNAATMSRYQVMPSLTDHMSSNVSQLFEVIGRERATNFLFSASTADMREVGYYTYDMNRMYREFSDVSKLKTDKARERFPDGIKLRRSWKTLKELHDDISRQYTKIKVFESRKHIRWDVKLKDLHGSKVDNLRILLPRTTTKIAMWGMDQAHCVASHADGMARGECAIFGVYKDRKLTYVGNISITKWERPQAVLTESPEQIERLNRGEVVYRLSEIRSYNNGKVDKADLEKIYSVLMRHNVENLYMDRWC